MKLGEIGAGPLFEAPGPRGKRIVRRVRGIAAELVGFVIVTALLPLLLAGALVVDIYMKLRTGKPMTSIRLAFFLWWFLLNEIWTLLALLGVWLFTGGPFGRGSMRRRRGIYWLRPALAAAQFSAFKLLFGLKYEIEGARGRGAGSGAADDPPRLDHRQRAAATCSVARPHGLGPALRDQARARDDPD